jgi:glycosyltransferase 2 family protein
VLRSIWRRIDSSASGFAIGARVCVTIGAVFLLFRSMDWRVIFDLVAKIDHRLLAISIILAALQFAIMVFRWRMIIAMLGGISVASTDLALSFGRSVIASQVLPSTVGADLVRFATTAGRTGVALAARSVIGDRVAGFVALILMAIAVIPLFAFLAGGGMAFTVLTSASAVGLTLLLIGLAHSDRLPWLGQFSMQIAADFRQIFGNGYLTLAVLMLSLSIHLLSVVRVYSLSLALNASTSLLQCLVVVPPILLISAIPISVGGWGVREGALAAGFALVGATSEAGIATSITFGLTGLLIAAVAELVVPLIKVSAATLGLGRKEPPVG